MPSHMLRKSLIATALVCAFAAAPFSQVLAQEANGQMQTSADTPTQKAADNQTVPDKAADAWITTKVKAELATAKNMKDSDISVETNDSVVMLTGTVASNSEKTRAMKLAKSVKGVKKVETSGLTVSTMHSDSMMKKTDHSMQNSTDATMQKTSDNQTVPDKASDAWITTKVKSELATAKNMKDSDISVETNDGVVMLSGTVASHGERTRAMKLAKSVKGVKKVETSGLTVSAMHNDSMMNKTDHSMPASSATVGH